VCVVVCVCVVCGGVCLCSVWWCVCSGIVCVLLCVCVWCVCGVCLVVSVFV